MLPETGFGFTLSFKAWTRPDPSRDPADTLSPDVLVPRHRRNMLDGTDPALDAVRAEASQERDS